MFTVALRHLFLFAAASLHFNEPHIQTESQRETAAYVGQKPSPERRSLFTTGLVFAPNKGGVTFVWSLDQGSNR